MIERVREDQKWGLAEMGFRDKQPESLVEQPIANIASKRQVVRIRQKKMMITMLIMIILLSLTYWEYLPHQSYPTLAPLAYNNNNSWCRMDKFKNKQYLVSMIFHEQTLL